MKVNPTDILQMNAFQSELEWWKGFVGNKNVSKGYMENLCNPETPILDYIAQYIKSENTTILDVGAGPVTQVGYRWQGKPIKVVAIDPLAQEYNTLPCAVAKPVTTQFGVGESLSEQFPKNTFDITHARNSLDHSFDPLKCIYEMIHVTKPNGYIILHHCIGEGQRANYDGLHQWDFFAQDSFFYISNKKRDTVINVTNHLDYLAQQVDIQTPAIYSTLEQDNVKWIDVYLQKRPE